MAAAPAVIEPCFDVDKLSYEIFTILESKFLFGYDNPKLFLTESSPETPVRPAISTSRVRILSVDGVSDYHLAAAYLACIESSLRRQSGNPDARIADYFDVAAGSGVGGVIAAMLFTRGADGRTLFSAEEALNFLAKNGPPSALAPKGLFRGMLQMPRGGAFRRIFGELTLRDTVKPLLIPCFDLSTGAPFLFSRADAVETDGYDFRIREICSATCTVAKPIKLSSIDGRTRLAAVGGGLAMANPTAAAITHVLHNKQEFPSAASIEDLLVVSIAGADGSLAVPSLPSTAEMLRIAGSGMADVVDQAIALAFSHNRTINSGYVRLQVHGRNASNRASNLDAKKMVEAAEDLLSQRNIESVLFRGKRLSNESNSEKLERFVGELISEHDERVKSPVPAVIIKPTATPRSSSGSPPVQ